MPDGYAAVCADGTQIVAPTAPGSVIFWADAPIPLYAYPNTPQQVSTYGMFLQARSGPFGHLAIVKAAISGNAILIHRQTRTLLDLGPTYGINCVGLQPDGTPVWTDPDPNYYHVGSQRLLMPAGHYSGAGFYIGAGGQPVWFNDQFVAPVIIHGLHFGLAVRPDGGDWLFGQAPASYDYLAYRYSTDEVFVAGPTANSPSPPGGALRPDGSCILARSQPPAWFPSETFTPYVPPPPDPVILPTFPATTQRIGIGCWNPRDGEPNLIGGDDIRNPATVGAVCTFYVTPSGLDTHELEDGLAVARRESLPLYCYVDAPDYLPEWVPIVPDVTILPLVQCTQKEGEADADFAARQDFTLRRLADKGFPVAVSLMAYLGAKGTIPVTYKRSKQSVVNGQLAVWNTMRAIRAVASFDFAYNRADGIVAVPELQETLRRRRAASSDWRHFPVAATATGFTHPRGFAR